MDHLEFLGEGHAISKEATRLINGVEFLAGLDKALVEALTRWIKVYKAPFGTTIFEEGSKNTSLCIIAEGEVDVFKETNPGEFIKIANIKSGGVIGEIGIIDGEPFSASAIASVNTTILVINADDFKRLMEEESQLGIQILMRIARIISGRLRKTTGLLTEFMGTDN